MYLMESMKLEFRSECSFGLILSRVRGSVTNNNGLWVLDWMIGFSVAAITITPDYNHL
jgi:hypothetical protein